MKKNNMWRFSLFIDTFFFEDALFAIIEVIYFTSFLNLKFSEYTYLTSFTLLIAFLFEFPSGIISDKFGRKKMLILGKFISIFSLLCFMFFGKNLLFIYVFQLFNVFGLALASGNSNVLIFENATQSIDKYEFEKISTRYFSFGAINSAFLAIIAVALYKISPYFPLLIDIIIKTFKLFFYYFLDDKGLPSPKKWALFVNLKHDLKNIFTKANISLINIIQIFAILFMVSRVSFTFYQPLMSEYNISLQLYGVLVFIVNIFCFVLSNMIIKYLKQIQLFNIVFMSIIVLLFQYIILFVPIKNSEILGLSVFLILFGIMQLIRIFSEGLSNYFINVAIADSEYKTSYFSLFQTLKIMSYSISIFLLGVLHNLVGNYTKVYLIFCLASIIILLISNKINKSQSLST